MLMECGSVLGSQGGWGAVCDVVCGVATQSPAPKLLT